MHITKSHAVCAAALAMIAAGAVFSVFGADKAKTVQLFAMDCVCTVSVSPQTLISECSEQIRELDGLLSAYDKGSDISRINNSDMPVKVSESTERLIKRAVSLNKRYPQTDCTSGRLIDLWNVTGDDPKIPDTEEIAAALETIGSENMIISDGGIKLENGAKLNFGSCAKGFALDEVRMLLDNKNAEYAVVSFGSSSLLYGRKPDGTNFSTEIETPDGSGAAALSFETGQCFISTSGGYERFFTRNGKNYSHIFDLKTGYPAEIDIASVTVITENDGMLSDFLSTCIYIEGISGLEKYLDSADFQVIAIDNKNNIYCSEGIRNSIEIKNTAFHFADKPEEENQ